MSEDVRPTPLLDQVQIPADLRRLREGDLAQLADELRQEMIAAVSVAIWAPAWVSSN
jgi:deoxyxylulose-5-phosphate synthase